MSNINTLLQLFSELSKEEKQKFLASLSVKVPQVSTFTPETKEEYLAKLRFPKGINLPSLWQYSYCQKRYSQRPAKIFMQRL